MFVHSTQKLLKKNCQNFWKIPEEIPYAGWKSVEFKGPSKVSMHQRERVSCFRIYTVQNLWSMREWLDWSIDIISTHFH